jgi:ribonucleotide monophosphatase NagD (HAD superfamily)
MKPPVLTDHFSTLAPHYDAVLSDVWGVVHNGVASFPAACEALTRFREKGGSVVLISNARVRATRSSACSTICMCRGKPMTAS